LFSWGRVYSILLIIKHLGAIHEFVEQLAVVPGDDDMVVSDGVRQEIVCLPLVVKSYHLLGATETGFVFAAHQFALGNKMA
jgi:hypothetical protein